MESPKLQPALTAPPRKGRGRPRKPITEGTSDKPQKRRGQPPGTNAKAEPIRPLVSNKISIERDRRALQHH